jgi:site-specific recombinase
MRKKKDTSISINNLKKKIKECTDNNVYIHLCYELVAYLRSNTPSIASWKMDNLIAELETDSHFQNALHHIISHILNTKDPQTIFTQIGISKGGTFMNEVLKIIKHNIIPELPHKHSLEYVIDQAFDKNSDYKWVLYISDEKWMRLFELIAFSEQTKLPSFRKNLIDSLTILAYKVPVFGLEDTHLSKNLNLEEGIKTPFISLNKQIMSLVHLLLNEENSNKNLLYAQADKCKTKIDECYEFIKNIANNIEKYGTSIEQTYILRRTYIELERMEYLITFLIPNSKNDILIKSIKLFKSTIKSLNKKHSLGYLYKSNASMLAYQIAEHKSASGEHYITTTRKEYLNFFNAAVAGGGIIAITATIKALLGNLDLAPFWQYFLYSVNYATAFVILFITGASLATKQPAMTASALASSLDNRKGTVDYKNFGITFSKVWRSQFASFAGNLITVFPLCYLISFAYTQFSGDLLLHNTEYAYKSLMDQHPTHSLAWLYACITGIFLFLSGIITGYVDNKVIYSNIGNRIYEHKRLKKILKPQQISKLSKYVQKNLGGYIGNICLGFFLGYAKLIGDFFGLPFDIRHITISTAYYAFGAENLNNNLVLADWIGITIGVIGIGFFNFIISFGLAFYVAINSRNVPVTETPKLAHHILKVFIKYPLDFIFPPKTPRKKEDVFKS